MITPLEEIHRAELRALLETCLGPETHLLDQGMWRWTYDRNPVGDSNGGGYALFRQKYGGATISKPPDGGKHFLADDRGETERRERDARGPSGLTCRPRQAARTTSQ